MTTPPPPVLTSSDSFTVEPPETVRWILLCVAPLNDVEFQLRQGKREMKVPMVSTSAEQVSFYLKLSDLGDQSPLTCRYRLSRMSVWSEDSEPLELMWSDETLPAPVFTAEPSAHQSFESGSTVQFRCTAPSIGLRSEAGLRFGLHLEDLDERTLLQTLKPSGNEALFQLQNLSVTDSATYSCIYTDLAPPFSGSAPSNFVILMVNVILRVLSTHRDLGLHFVGPQHTGNYTCRYTFWGPKPVDSEPSNPVELLVEGN
ncbi:Alpha-1B-glycoprotein [Apodemus speciosus]|uniref:Alpha-1B-glycoprotein n=1 Tax=Apodemus speciosus TaxID=105296 RepID=A0ABQ0FJH7_APOSI